MPATIDRRTQAVRRATTESALLDAAALLAATKGIDNTSLAEIGEAAGYSRGIVNHHFGTKSALVERLVVRTQEAVLSSLPLDGAGAVSLLDICAAYLDIVTSNEPWSRAFITLWGAATPQAAPLREIFAERDRWFREQIAARVRAGQQAGVVAHDADPTAIAIAVAGMLRGVAAQYFVNPNIDLEATKSACDAMVRALIHEPPPTKSGAPS